MSALDTIPRTVEQGSQEDLVLGVDVAAQLAGVLFYADGEPIKDPLPGDVQTVTLAWTALKRGSATTVTLADPPSVDGTVIRQRVRAGVLRPGGYTLAVFFTPSGTTNVLESVLNITCER